MLQADAMMEEAIKTIGVKWLKGKKVTKDKPIGN